MSELTGIFIAFVSVFAGALVCFLYLKMRVLIPLSYRLRRIKTKLLANGRKRIQTEFERMVEEHQKEIDEFEKTVKEEAENFYDVIEAKLIQERDDMMERNTLYFNCSCNEHDKIPCVIDFTKEDNTFTCPKCNSVWKVMINARPVLRGYNVGNPDTRHLEKLKERVPFSKRESLVGEDEA